MGAIDGKHWDAHISKGGAGGSHRDVFRNYKTKTTTLQSLGVCDSEKKLVFLMVGAEGGMPDGTQWQISQLETKIPPGFFLIADGGFPLSTCCVTPYRGVRYHLREWRAADGVVFLEPKNKKQELKNPNPRRQTN
jgi:hypothetical protein